MFSSIILINQAKVSIPIGENVWERSSFGVVNNIASDGTARNILEWLIFIALGEPLIASIAVTDVTYIDIQFNDRVDYARFHPDLKGLLGFTIDAPAASLEYIAPLFGTYRLPLQGVDHPTDPRVCSYREQSKITDMNLIEFDGINDTFESIDYVTNSYEGDFDLERWVIEVSDFPYDFRQQVVDFFDQISIVASDSPPVRMYGEGFYIEETDVFKVLMNVYKGVKIQAYTNKYITFKVGLREFPDE